MLKFYFKNYLLLLLVQIPVHLIAQEWQLQTTPTTNKLNDVFFSSKNNGTAVGDNATIIHTNNGGLSWFAEPCPTVASLNGVFFTDDTIGTSVGFLGAILRTTDGGYNWSQQSANTDGVLSDVWFFDVDNGIITQGGVVHHTTDGGLNWTHDTVSTERGLGKIAFGDDSTGVILAGGDRSSSYLFRTGDGGQSWTEVVIPVGSGFDGISFASPTTAIIVGSAGNIYKTTDRGQNWTAQNSGTTDPLFDVSCPTPTTYFVVGLNGAVLRTTDGGDNWNGEPNPLEGVDNLYAVHFIDANTGWAVGANGKVMYRYFQDTTKSITEQKLSSSIGEANDHLGISVSISEKYPGNQYAVIGVSGDNANKGTAYIYEIFGGAAIEQIVAASEGQTDDFFGCAVSIDSQTTIIGAVGDDDRGTDAGAAYVYGTRGNNGWAEQIKLTAGDGAPGDSFGVAVAISGNHAIVGAPAHNNATGAVYLFKQDENDKSLWTEQQKLVAADGSAGDYFGCSVALDSSSAIIGAHRADIGSNTDQGAAYIFRFAGSNWLEQAKLSAADGQAGDQFGCSVSISGLYALIGARNSSTGKSSSGSAYAYQWDGIDWIEKAKLVSDDASDGQKFGAAVSISGKDALISAPGDGEMGPSAGAAYLYSVDSLGSWKQNKKLTADDGAANDHFGHSVALAQGIALCGAPFADAGSAESGAAYLYHGYIATALDKPTPLYPQQFTLNQNYPNPFNPQTTINYSLNTAGMVELSVFDMLGRKIKSLVNQRQSPGQHIVIFDATGLASGVYIYQLKVNATSISRKLILLE